LKRYQVVIVGAGPAGISAAIWSTRLKLSTCIVEKEPKIGGQLIHIHNPIIDYPGFLSTTGEELLQGFENHLAATDADIYLSQPVIKVDPQERLIYTHACEIQYQNLILATGASDRQLGIPGEQLLYRQKYSASRDRHLFRGKHVCIVGGGDRAFEGAWLLAEAGAQVSLVHRSDDFRARLEFREKVMGHPNIRILTHTIVKKICGDGQIQAVELASTIQPEHTCLLPIDALFVRIGVQPNCQLLDGIATMEPNGTCKVDSFFATTVDHIYCIGDAHVHPDYSSIAVSVAQGMIAAKRISLCLEEE
jgi:thioredoxin reductase (NADPH)